MVALRLATEGSRLPIALTGGASHTVLHANPALCRLLERAPDDLVGRPLLRLFEVAGDLGAVLDEVYRTGVVDVASELTHAPAGGRVVHCIAIAAPAPGGEAPGLVVGFVDTTEQASRRRELARVAAEVREANEALILAGLRERDLKERATELYEQAQRATHAREDLLAIVSHELRDPLGTILMTLHLLRREPEIAGGARPRKHVETLERTTERMKRLVEDLLDAVGIEAGHLSIERRPLDAAGVAAEAFDTVRPFAERKAVALARDLAADLPLVSADRGRLLQVLANLLGNAIKFTPPCGTVTLTIEAAEGEARFSIRDTGPGIPSESLPHVFDRFWQGHPAARSGAGMGLFIVRGIVEAHGGRVRVESEAGAGSVFTFTIPAAAGEARARGE